MSLWFLDSGGCSTRSKRPAAGQLLALAQPPHSAAGLGSCAAASARRKTNCVGQRNVCAPLMHAPWLALTLQSEDASRRQTCTSLPDTLVRDVAPWMMRVVHGVRALMIGVRVDPQNVLRRGPVLPSRAQAPAGNRPATAKKRHRREKVVGAVMIGHVLFRHLHSGALYSAGNGAASPRRCGPRSKKNNAAAM